MAEQLIPPRTSFLLNHRRIGFEWWGYGQPCRSQSLWMLSMKNGDHLSNAVGVKGQLTDTSISVRTKSRAVAALDRLCGAAMDVPAASLENMADRIRGKGRIVSTLQDAAMQKINEAEDIAPVIDAIVASGIDSFVNQKYVTERAVAHLVSHGHETDFEPESTAEEVDADWLNYFSGYAEKASSEKVRDLWGRVLAGEVRRPGAFSLSTLRFLAEMDQKIATLFEEEVRFRYHGRFIVRTSKRLEGELLDRLKLLEEVGLIHFVNPIGGMNTSIEFNKEKIAVMLEGKVCLILRADEKIEVGMEVIPLTRTGQEIATILPPVDSVEVLRRVAQEVKMNNNIVSIALHRVAHIDQTTERLEFKGTPFEVLKSPE